MKRVIFVCTGNTCRSPMAEKIAKGLWGEGAPVISRGFGHEGEPMAENARQALEAMDIPVGEHMSKRLTEEEIKGCDLILTMTEGHKRAILSAFPDMEDKVFTLGEYSGVCGDISDPFAQSLDVYKSCCKQIYECIKAINY